jgi:hypothetical protein
MRERIRALFCVNLLTPFVLGKHRTKELVFFAIGFAHIFFIAQMANVGVFTGRHE